MAKRRSSGRFALGMIVYALTFIVFLAIGLRIFWGMIDSYEKSQPSHASSEGYCPVTIDVVAATVVGGKTELKVPTRWERKNPSGVPPMPDAPPRRGRRRAWPP